MEPLISVIIPIYNMEVWLPRCLDSILNNSYQNLEILCVDDGSKDKTSEILHVYAEKDSRVIVITKENGGVSSARNAGLHCVTGEYITFVDPDDFVHPQYIELLYQALVETGTEISACELQRFGPDEPLPQSEPIILAPQTIQAYSFTQVFRNHEFRSYCCCKMIRAESALKVRFREDMQFGEDTMFFREVCEAVSTAKAAIIPCSLYYYFQRDGSLSKLVDELQFMQLLRVSAQKLTAPDGRDDIYLDYVLKRGLSIRYLVKHIRPDRELARECTELLKNVRYRLWKTCEYGMKMKLFYIICTMFPGVYRLYRIIADPSMLTWEKLERQKRQIENKNN